MSRASDHAWHYPSATAQRATGRFGTWVFLLSELLLFAPLLLAYVHARMAHGSAFVDASHHTQIWLGTANTALLLTSSLTMALAVRAAGAGERRLPGRLLLATLLLGASFLAVKGFEYAQEWQEGLVPGLHFTHEIDSGGALPLFFFLYFLMTGVHALHLAIGIGLVGWLRAQIRRGPLGTARRAHVEDIGLYWHFVDALWVFLYPLFYLLERYR